ncbi:hypothetical protein ScPMuIL_007084 [Solemya velum]
MGLQSAIELNIIILACHNLTYVIFVIDLPGGIHKPGVCTLWGEPHVVQFDGNYFHHTGICEYVVARDQCSTNRTWTFLVTAKMIEVNSPIVSMVFSVKIETADAVIDMGWGYGI